MNDGAVECGVVARDGAVFDAEKPRTLCECRLSDGRYAQKLFARSYCFMLYGDNMTGNRDIEMSYGIILKHRQ